MRPSASPVPRPGVAVARHRRRRRRQLWHRHRCAAPGEPAPADTARPPLSRRAGLSGTAAAALVCRPRTRRSPRRRSCSLLGLRRQRLPVRRRRTPMNGVPASMPRSLLDGMKAPDPVVRRLRRERRHHLCIGLARRTATRRRLSDHRCRRRARAAADPAEPVRRSLGRWIRPTGGHRRCRSRNRPSVHRR